MTLDIQNLESISTTGALEIRYSEGKIEFIQHGEIKEDLFSKGGFTIDLVKEPKRTFYSENEWTYIFEETLIKFKDDAVIGFDYQIFLVGQIYQSEIKVLRRDEAYVAFQIFSFIEIEIIESSEKVIDFLNEYYNLKTESEFNFNYSGAKSFAKKVDLRGLEINVDKRSIEFLQTGRESATWSQQFLSLIIVGSFLWLFILFISDSDIIWAIPYFLLMALATYALDRNPIKNKDLLYRNCKFSRNIFEFQNDAEAISYFPISELNGVSYTVNQKDDLYQSSLVIGTINNKITFLELFSNSVGEVEKVSKSIISFLENNFQIPMVKQIQIESKNDETDSLEEQLFHVQKELDSEYFTINIEEGRLLLLSYVQFSNVYENAQIPIFKTEIGNNKVSIQSENTKDLVSKNDVLEINYRIGKVGGFVLSESYEAMLYLQTPEESILFAKLNHNSKHILMRRVIILIEFLNNYIKK